MNDKENEMLSRMMGRREAEETAVEEGPEPAAIDAAAELELLRRDVSRAASALRVAKATLRRERNVDAMDPESERENRHAEVRASKQLEAAEECVSRFQAKRLDFPADAVARIEELEEMAANLAAIHPRAIERARTTLEALLDAIEEVFRGPALLEMAKAEAHALAVLFDLEEPGPFPEVSISRDVRRELTSPPIGDRVRAAERLGSGSKRLTSAASVLEDGIRIGERSSVKERRDAIRSIAANVTSSSLPLVEALQERIRELEDS